MNILLDRAALCYQMGDVKKALECYEAALKVTQLCKVIQGTIRRHSVFSS